MRLQNTKKKINKSNHVLRIYNNIDSIINRPPFVSTLARPGCIQHCTLSVRT